MALMPILPRRLAAGIGRRLPDGTWVSQEELGTGDIVDTPSVERKKLKLVRKQQQKNMIGGKTMSKKGKKQKVTNSDLVMDSIPVPQAAQPALATMAPGIGIKNPWTGEWYQPPVETRDTKPLLSEEPVKTSRDSVNAPGDKYRFTSKP